ncbi:unnamed protein product [Choristocarpus tenellus]
MAKLWSMVKSAFTISIEDQIQYRPRTVQIGPHIIIVTSAEFGATVPRLTQKFAKWSVQHGGHTIWGCAPLLSSYLVKSGVTTGKRVLELGSGMGVCGLIAHRVGASEVVLTDGDQSLLSHLHENIMVNIGFYGEEKSEEGCRPAHSCHLRWGNNKDAIQLMEELGPFDVVLGSDLIYPEAVKKTEVLALMGTKVRDFFSTAAASLRAGGILLVTHELRPPVEECLQLLAVNATDAGFGEPTLAQMDRKLNRLVLSIPWITKDWYESKDGTEESVLRAWANLFPILEVRGPVADRLGAEARTGHGWLDPHCSVVAAGMGVGGTWGKDLSAGVEVKLGGPSNEDWQFS